MAKAKRAETESLVAIYDVPSKPGFRPVLRVTVQRGRYRGLTFMVGQDDSKLAVHVRVCAKARDERGVPIMHEYRKPEAALFELAAHMVRAGGNPSISGDWRAEENRDGMYVSKLSYETSEVEDYSEATQRTQDQVSSFLAEAR